MNLNKVRVFAENFLIDCRDIVKALVGGVGFGLVVVIELATAVMDIFMETPWLGPAFLVMMFFLAVTCY